MHRSRSMTLEVMFDFLERIKFSFDLKPSVTETDGKVEFRGTMLS